MAKKIFTAAELESLFDRLDEIEQEVRTAKSALSACKAEPVKEPLTKARRLCGMARTLNELALSMFLQSDIQGRSELRDKLQAEMEAKP
jgi:hypothetical protein